MKKKLFSRCTLLVLSVCTTSLELWSSNIVSLSSLKNKHQEVHIIGDETRYELFPNTCFDLRALLGKLNEAPLKTAVVFFDVNPKKEISEREEYHSSNQKGGPYYSLRERLLKIALEYWENPHNNGFHPTLPLKNLHFLKFPDDTLDQIEMKVSTALEFLGGNNAQAFKQIFKCVGIDSEDINDFQLQLDLDDKKKKRFFNPKLPSSCMGSFNCLKAYIIKKATTYPEFFARISEYNKLITVYSKRINDLPDSPATLPFKKYWNALKVRALSYLKLHNDKNKDISFCALYLKVAFEKESLIDSYEEFRDQVITPVSLIRQFKTLQLLLQMCASYDKIICFNHFVSVSDMINVLQLNGFKEKCTMGEIPEGADGLVAFYHDELQKKIISIEKVESFFNSMILSAIENCNFSVKNESLSKDTSFVLYLKDDISSVYCSTCNEIIKAYNACARSENKIYCSPDCLLKKFFLEEKGHPTLSTLLDKNRILTDDEKLILKQFGALCYLRVALLMPSLVQEYGIVYQLPLSTIITALGKIESVVQDITNPWSHTVELAQQWGIKLIDLKLFLSVYKMAKQNYLETLLKHSVNSSYESLAAKYHTAFDREGQCANLQKVAYTNIKKALNLSNDTENISLVFFYTTLIDQINSRVGLPVESIEDLLAVTYKDQNIAVLLQSMGFRENPCTYIKKNYRKKKQIETAREESSSEDENSFSSGPFLPYLFPATEIHDKTPFTLVQHNQRKKTRVVKSLFAGTKPYHITLFKARKYVPQELLKAQEIWKSCKQTTESFRIKVLFALADSLENQNPSITFNSFGCPLIVCNDTAYDESIKEKLDLNHLFTRHIDTSVNSYGIAEVVGNLIQVSIPGEIHYDGITKIGFFQYSYTSQGVCIHRCFKSYNANQNSTYISPALRKILYDCLQDLPNAHEYENVIKDLKQLVHEGK
ncbi:hypothetical protein H0X06_02550 [Candidatus Dependentiae bacterium]|nr:hypothetical protein [Candidatus Dependentiae bacterium]